MIAYKKFVLKSESRVTKILKFSGICFLLGISVVAAWWSYAYYKYSQYLPEHTVYVESHQRSYNLFFPENSSKKPLDIVVYFAGGSAGSDGAWLMPQQQLWEELAAKEGIIIAIPQGKIFFDNESAWQLNTDLKTMQDINFIDAMLEDIRVKNEFEFGDVYGVGYSLGSMFSYEIACQMSGKFAAIASFAGTMPVRPKTCDPEKNVSIMHIHGMDDPIIQYHKSWDWKAWNSVGTMRDVPSLMEYWIEKFNCTDSDQKTSESTVHTAYFNCNQDAKVEHYALLAWDHEWPKNINGTSTPLLIWRFLNQSGERITNK